MSVGSLNPARSNSCWEAVARLPRKMGTHAGLLLSRYLPIWTDALKDVDTKERNESKRELLDSTIAACASVPELFEYAFMRWKDCIDATIQKTLYVKNRMIVGLGCDSVLETGITLHHTYGTPIIPGSALKGLASHYCHHVWGQKNNDSGDFDAEFKAFGVEDVDKDGKKFERQGQYHRFLFGTNEHAHSANKHAGYIIFHDAWIYPESLKSGHPLAFDVMTPHHGDYYSGKDATAAPTDFDDPNPVTFLSVPGRYIEKGSKAVPNVGKFLVAISCTVNEPGARQEWAKLAMDLLCQALEYWGVGGKTNAGYGRLVDKPELPSIKIETPRGEQASRGGGRQYKDRKPKETPPPEDDGKSAKEKFKETKKKMRKKGFKF